jgi:hypothetical protein
VKTVIACLMTISLALLVVGCKESTTSDEGSSSSDPESVYRDAAGESGT